MYYPGAICFTSANGEPKVGELLEQAWTITETCRFKVLKNGEKSVTDNQADNEAEEEYEEPSETSNSKLSLQCCNY